MNVFSYIRVSGLGQVDKDGPKRQREAVEKFCQRHNLAQTAEFFEEGVSGTIEGLDRPMFADMIEKIELFKQIETLRIDAIVVECMDRLARDLMVSEVLLRECRTRGIKVYAADGELVDVASNEIEPTRKMMRQIFAAIAECDKSLLVRKLHNARLRKRQNGQRCEGAKPYGCKPFEENALNLMRDYQAKHYSYSQIAEEMNEGGVQPRFGQRWTKSSVYSILNPGKRKKKKL